jgi:hypothetical protein
MYATQPHVNADFATPISSNRGNLPVVQRIGDEFYVRDGHHRLTKLATEGAETAKVNLVDPWERTPTEMPLLDWKPKTPEQVASERALAQKQKQENDALYNDLMSAGFGDIEPQPRAHGGLVDDALHVVRERHADGEAVGQAPEMPVEEPRPLTIYRGNAPVADEAGGSGREPSPPAFSYMPMPESVERQAARQPAYNPVERTWSDAGSTEGERLTRALGVEGELPKGETFMSAQPSGWDKYMPQRVPGTFLKRTGEAFNENADAVSEGLKAVREGNYGAGALGMVGGALGAAISPLTGMERVLVRDPYLRMTGNLKDAQAAEMAADVALTGGLRGMVKPFAKAGNLEKLAAEPMTSAYRLPSPAATGAATAAAATLAPDEAEAGALSKAMEVARMAIPRELSPLGFYSHGAEAARGLSQAKGTPEQFAAMLQKSGVKGPEMEGFLKTFGGRPIVTQDEAAQYFKGAMPQVEETVLAGRKPVLSEVEKEKWIDAQAAERARETGDIEHVRDWANASPEIRDWHKEEAIKNFNERMVNDFGFAEQFNDYVGTPTKFSQYTLPGGENYREVLLKMPVQGNEAAALNKIAQDMYGKNYTDLMGDTSDLAKMRLAIKREYKNQYGESGLKAEDAAMFRSSHWDDPNVLAHLRMADRTGPNGEKILHVEEIQSDWGQKGKKEGFRNEKPSLTPQEKEEFDRLTSIPYRERSTEEQARHFELDNKRKDIGQGVPPAPYVTNTQAWTDLALKRALKEAAEGGYDKLVWTPGAEQAKRYDLSKQISRLVLENDPAGGHKLRAYSPSGDQVINKRIVDADRELPDLIGKDVAKKLLDQDLVNPKVFNEKLTSNDIIVVPKEGRYQISAPWGWSTHVGMGVVNSPEAAAEYGARHFSNLAKEANSNMGTSHATEYKNATRSLVGQDLSVGGEGMKGYYDKIVPNQLSKLVKKLDPEAKIGRDAIQTQDTPRTMAYFLDWAAARGDNRPRPTLGQVWQNGANEPLVQQFMKETSGLEVPSLTITPAMREAIMKGQTAFKDGGSVEDRALMLVSRQA